MIKPINITPLNTAKELAFECENEKCKLHGVMYLENSIVNTDNDGNSLSPLEDFNCPQCGEKL